MRSVYRYIHIYEWRDSTRPTNFAVCAQAMLVLCMVEISFLVSMRHVTRMTVSCHTLTGRQGRVMLQLHPSLQFPSSKNLLDLRLESAFSQFEHTYARTHKPLLKYVAFVYMCSTHIHKRTPNNLDLCLGFVCYVCICTYTYIYIHICKYVYIYTYTYIHICMHIQIYIYIYIHIYTYIYMHAYTYIHVYTYIHICIPAFTHTHPDLFCEIYASVLRASSHGAHTYAHDMCVHMA